MNSEWGKLNLACKRSFNGFVTLDWKSIRLNFTKLYWNFFINRNFTLLYLSIGPSLCLSFSSLSLSLSLSLVHSFSHSFSFSLWLTSLYLTNYFFRSLFPIFIIFSLYSLSLLLSLPWKIDLLFEMQLDASVLKVTTRRHKRLLNRQLSFASKKVSLSLLSPFHKSWSDFVWLRNCSEAF